MKNFYFLLIALFSLQNGFTQSKVKDLLTENKINPIGVNTKTPRFSWKLSNNNRNIFQTAYEIKISANNKNIWNSGKVISDSSVLVEYKGKPLKSETKYHWQVRVWDNSHKPSAWSSPAFFQTALLNNNEFTAKWIEPGYIEDSVMRPSPLMRKEFSSTKKITSAVVYITAHGMYEAYINGKRVGDAYFSPGWTSYHKRLQYQTYDVTTLLNKGENVIGVILGNGWYRSHIGFTTSRDFYGKDIALLLQLNIHYSDGSTSKIISDETWKSSTGEIRFSEIYDGEIIDNRKEKTGWLNANYNDKEWYKVNITNHSNENLLATYNEPIKKMDTLYPKKIFTTPKGEKVIDFGQNLVGWVQMTASGKSGDTIKLSHGEVLDKNGNFYNDNLRSAKAQNVYVLCGEAKETFRPHFTWQGFRYLKIEGYPGQINPDNFKAIVLFSYMNKTGLFTTSNSLINQLQSNIEWGQKGNFLDVPTDCPQRDERLGWTGDAQAFIRTATFNRNVHSFFTKWLKDLEAEQKEGAVPFVVPDVITNGFNSAGWADAATIIPWNIYVVYGDKKVLAEQYNSMKAYVESIRKVAQNNLWNTGFHFGDWLFYRPDDDNDGRSAVTDKYLIAQCFYAHSTQLLINAAKVLGKNQDVQEYQNLLNKIKKAFKEEYMTPNGRLVSGTQTAYVLALNFDMLPEEIRSAAAKRLADNVNDYGHLTTGFLGTPYLCHVLTRFGYDDIAYKLLLREDYPSWLYPVKAGATTIWERWDGQKPDGTNNWHEFF